MAAAVGDALPFTARLSGGFKPSKRGPTRAAGDRAPELSPDARIALALLEKRATEDPTPAALADLGLAYLIQGDIDRAIATIEDAASQDDRPAPWSDLSAAYLAKAERAPQRKIEYLARALEAAEKSLKIAKTNEALFNRALARDGLAPYTGTPAPWQEFASAERDPAWREAGAKEAGNDPPAEDARDQWERRRQDLTTRLTVRDATFVTETVRQYPEASIEYLDQVLFGDPAALDSAAFLAATIFDVTGDALPRDQVAALRSHPALISAHQTLSAGIADYNANRLPAARRSFEDALASFARVRAPYARAVEMRLAEIDWRENAFDSADRLLTKVEHDARRRAYHTLLTRALSQRGLLLNRQWRVSEGLAAFREGAAVCETAGLHESAVSFYSSLADALRMLGESQDSWVYVGRTLEGLSRLRRPLRRYLLLYNATLFSSRQGLTEAALLFQDAAVREAQKANTDAFTEALVHRANVQIRRGDTDQARRDIEEATQLASATTSTAFQQHINAELGIVRAQLSGGDPIRDLEAAIAFFGRTDPGRVPALYLALARTPQAQSRPGVTERALQAGIDRLETQQAGLAEESLRISFFDEAWMLFHDMVALRIREQDTAGAFAYAERSRARSLLAATQGAHTSHTKSLSEVQRLLPASAVLVHYSTLADRILIWHISAAQASLIERPITERELTRLIDQHRAAIRERRASDAANRLYALLIEPIVRSLPAATTLVLVPDGYLQQLSFATLRNPTTRRYLIEDHSLVVSPSATFFVEARSAGAPATAGLSALMIGNPAAAAARALPGAETEAAVAARHYSRAEVLTGQLATKERFVQAAPGADVVHFGGHALANPEYPSLSRLVFADKAGVEQSLFAHEISRMKFQRTRVVVLAACSTAAGAVSRGEGVVSVARPFLGGGVPLVIASQWDVDDRATQQLTVVFHRELAATRNPIQALRAAQLALLRSGDAALASPLDWGAFVAIGTAAP